MMKWEWKGRKLAHPLTIIRRLIFLVPLWMGELLVYASLFLGWGVSDAQRFWSDRP